MMVAGGAVVLVPISDFPEAGAHMIVLSRELTDTDVLDAMVIRSCRGQRVRRPWQERHGHEHEHREENAQQPHGTS